MNAIDKKTLIHVGAEAAVLGTLTIYLLGRISALEKEVKDLRNDLQIVAKKSVLIENSVRNGPPQPRRAVSFDDEHQRAPPQAAHQGGHQQTSHVHHHQPANPPQQRNVHPPQNRPPPRVQEAEEDEDDALLASEFGEPEEPVRPPPQQRMVRPPAGRGVSRRTNDMDDVKAKAARMAAAAGSDD